MNEKETVMSLISYLNALSEISRNSDVKVHGEIRRVIAKLERLLNN
jgi:hypothetical protein